MAVRIEPGPPLSEERLIEFERHLGWTLPPGYRHFLLTSNGGEPEPNVVLAGDLETTVRRFYSIGVSGTSGIEWALQGTGPFPPGLLPIGYEDGGNSYLLDTSGAVLYWDHERELEQADPENPGLGPATPLATSFDEFLDSLMPD